MGIFDCQIITNLLLNLLQKEIRKSCTKFWARTFLIVHSYLPDYAHLCLHWIHGSLGLHESCFWNCIPFLLDSRSRLTQSLTERPHYVFDVCNDSRHLALVVMLTKCTDLLLLIWERPAPAMLIASCSLRVLSFHSCWSSVYLCTKIHPSYSFILCISTFDFLTCVVDASCSKLNWFIELLL